MIHVTQEGHVLNALAWPYNVERVTLLSCALSITEQKKFWELLTQRFNRFKFCATTHNSMQSGAQTDYFGTCWPGILRPLARRFKKLLIVGRFLIL